jgi:RNA polymerase sigma-70 factor (ECF subfamily)
MKIGEESDDVLVRRAREGDHEAFAGLVDRYKRGIANFIGGAVKNGGDVADLTQDTFLRAYAHLGTFNPALGRFSTWIYQIARNVVRTHLGKSAKRPATHAFPEDQTLENAVPDLSRDADPAGGLLREEAERELRAALADLPERMRTVLSLRYFDNMEYHAIAGTLGLSLGNVKTLIHRGKIALAKRLRERDAAATQRTLPHGGGTRALLLV